jgi:chromosome segregation ATPase
METIEQLQQDNAKLQERLNNAAKFFREQKAQIEALTKENEELKRIHKEEVISTEKLDALVTEKENLNKQLKDKDIEINNYKEALNSCNIQLKDYEKINNDLLKKTENLNNQCNEYELKLQKSEEDLEKRIQQIRAVEKTYDQEQKKIISARDELQKKYEEAVKKFINIENEKNKQIEVYNIKFRELELKFDAVSKEYIKKFEDQNKEIEKLNDQKCAYENDCIELKKQLEEKDKKNKDLETINDTINKQLDDEENLRLAIESDYNDLVERINNIDENTCKFNKKDINEFCDNMIDFFKNHQL